MMDAVHRYDGYVAQSRGDGIFALFGAPIAFEDHAVRAIHAGLRMQAEIKRHSQKLRLEKGVNLAIRVGLNTGEVVVRSIRTEDLHTDYVPIGHSINLAARLDEALLGRTMMAQSALVQRLLALSGFSPYPDAAAAATRGKMTNQTSISSTPVT